ncbi:MAG: ABC transporter permease [Gemmatimonadales bacterium]|jgi:putative ABC transport system permease protein|nr:MAG: ABC transporter permease [Gemmatimonadales bacterium]
MSFREALRLALQSILGSKLRSFFTLLGIIVSVGFLVAVVAIIQGMNAYVKENITGAVIGTNAFQVRRTPVSFGLMDDEEVRSIAKRPLVTTDDAEVVRRALPDAEAVAFQSGWPTPTSDLTYRNQRIGDVLVFGITPAYQIVRDYVFAAGDPMSEPDVTGRRMVAIVGFDVADKLFGDPEKAIGKAIRIAGREFTIKGVVAKKGKVLGQSFDGFALIPYSTFESIYGRRKTTVVSVKMRDADEVEPAMARAQEAMRLAHKLRPNEPDDFTVDKADALVAFWKRLTKVLFTIVPAVVCIGIVVGGIVIMNIMLMTVNERTREIGVRKSLGATRRDIQRQFLVEAATLSFFGGILGVVAGWSLALLVSSFTPLPARVTLWSISLALALGIGTGLIFGVYPASRAAKLDPMTALRAE